LALQPNRAGRGDHSRQIADDLRGFISEHLSAFPSWHDKASFYVRPGYRSYRFRDVEPVPHARFGVLHLDGGGAVAHAWDYRGDNPTANNPYYVGDEDLVAALINSLQLLAAWASEYCGVDSDAAVLAQIHAPRDGAVLWQYRADIRERLPGSEPLEGQTALVDMTVNLRSLLSSGIDLLLSARSLAEDLMSWFEFIEPLQIDRDGRLRIRYFFGARHAAIEAWATEHGVETTNE
jgi:hypothetical protein